MPTLIESAAPSTVHDAVLLDLDGVVYRGAQPVEHAAEAIGALSDSGATPVYVTNNANRPPSVVADQLDSLGIPTDPAHVMTASLAGAAMLATMIEPGSRVLAVGGAGLIEALEGHGFQVVDSATDEPVAVIQGFAPTIGWPQLTEAAYAINAGATYVATNLDATLPTERGMAVGNGSLIAAVRNATGVDPVSSGKPQPGIFHQAAALVGSQRPIAVGDRLDTDLAGAVAAGYVGMHVLTGVSRVPHLLRAAPAERPNLLALDLRGLHQEHPAVSESGGRWRCRSAIVERGSDELILRRGEQTMAAHSVDHLTMDELRALCEAAWTLSDDGESAGDLPTADLPVHA
ncbi:HAD-IIA family hydrolase [Serinibacter salmoneus]|nr:HAD-IIA family hydrolase [Serinibacter salmoneus]